MNSRELIFVYNADGGIGDLLFDFFHKMFSPPTYPCSLCFITYGRYGVKNKTEWKKFLKSLPYKIVLLHKNEFHASYPNLEKIPLPAVYIQDGNEPTLLISSKKMDACKNLNDLIELVRVHATG
jgi:hypothetical protein